MSIRRLFLGFLLLSSTAIFAQNSLPELFLFLGGNKVSLQRLPLDHSCIKGVQIIYPWKQLEPKKNVYDFSQIKEDLKLLTQVHKKLFIQIQDRSFSPDIFNVPDYIREEGIYHGGVEMQYDFPGEGKKITTGWVSRMWDPAVRERYKLLLQKLAIEFDGKVYGINLPETSTDFDPEHAPKDFTENKYFYSVIDVMMYLRKNFQKSIVIQYVNFLPGEWDNDHQYMYRLFELAMKYHIGLGGPDVVPYKRSQMKNSYPFFQKYKDKILAAFAIQEPDYTYTNPKTGNFYSFDEFYSFATTQLGASILFWNMEEPFFSTQLLPNLTAKYFDCNEIKN